MSTPVPATAHVQVAVPPIPEPADTKELTLQNTLQNAGRRRSSSTTQPGSASRRQSSASIHDDDNAARLKWDEVNLYLTEQDRTAKMKIDEPKTPYAPHYDPAQDEEEMQLEEAADSLIDAKGVVVDELDRSTKPAHPKRGVSEDEIPDLELGEPEESLRDDAEDGSDPRIYRDRSLSTDSHKSEKHVQVGETNGDAVPGESQGTEKHAQFEAQRKRHYEMRNIKELLAHPENLDEMEEDEDETEPTEPPAMPELPDRFRDAAE
ncbi:hypothetical protein N7468_008301 [Penicillium chermesinum]|uniref:Glc8 protein n=1 Tax=Penicillium chermesinum TaxID=63820 RepID=A0A9W9TII5_9EURO|nr:uncharacterized protein N7468_008301 [Penicillium chermesinum]KAJ5223759.1 hypothetical protein N7468_008301 [Penicillium chermesinum]